MWENIISFGSSALLMEWPEEISRRNLIEISYIHSKLVEIENQAIIDIVPAYATLTIYFMPENISFTEIKTIILSFPKIPDNFEITESRLWQIKVKYDDGLSRDMQILMYHSGLSSKEIIEIHSSVLYDIYFIGFLPGFLYLGGLDRRLHIPRKATPDSFISAGSVAIGGGQTGVYPQNSPGGWYVIGHTDFKAIDVFNHPYCKIKPGDRVSFIPVL